MQLTAGVSAYMGIVGEIAIFLLKRRSDIILRNYLFYTTN